MNPNLRFRPFFFFVTDTCKTNERYSFLKNYEKYIKQLTYLAKITFSMVQFNPINRTWT